LSAAASKLADYARQVGGVDASKVESAVTNQRYSEVIRRHRRAARKHGVRATPSFVVGNDSVVSGNRYAKLTSLIERETGSSNGTENSTASPPNSSG
ncbi:MAG: thioredoxin domain-containing protein, partial [Halobacteria archaeon]|nr:thioredoxin domain-containing protein [Halobacteria archaeon]